MDEEKMNFNFSSPKVASPKEQLMMLKMQTEQYKLETAKNELYTQKLAMESEQLKLEGIKSYVRYWDIANKEIDERIKSDKMTRRYTQMKHFYDQAALTQHMYKEGLIKVEDIEKVENYVKKGDMEGLNIVTKMYKYMRETENSSNE